MVNIIIIYHSDRLSTAPLPLHDSLSLIKAIIFLSLLIFVLEAFYNEIWEFSKHLISLGLKKMNVSLKLKKEDEMLMDL
jgi:hypothetical protein